MILFVPHLGQTYRMTQLYQYIKFCVCDNLRDYRLPQSNIFSELYCENRTDDPDCTATVQPAISEYNLVYV